MINNMAYDVDFTKGLVEKSDSSRIEKVFERAKRGEELTIGFLGGSITQDAVTSDHKLCYAYRVYDWFCKTFPNATFKYVNAGIGATDSQFAAARVKEQLLSYKPDFVLMEHAVNDDGKNAKFLETYEGTLRQILKSGEEAPAVLLMCNVFYDDGASAERMHRTVARHYNIPVVSMRTTIYEALLQGKFENKLITHDNLHPNDDGHGLVAKVITTYLEGLLNGENVSDEGCAYDKDTLPAPLTLNRYESSIKYDNRNASFIEMEGFELDLRPQEGPRDCFKNGYVATEKGAFVELETECSCVSVQFRRTINLPAPIAKVVIDGDEASAVILDANFDETWGDKLDLVDVYTSEEIARHRVRVEVIETHPDDKGDFYLASIIVAGTR